MDLQLIALADNANIAAGDKLNIMGIFDTIWAPQFPTMQPFMVLAMRFRVGYEDGGKKHTIVVVLKDQDGKDYLRAQAQAEVAKIPPGTWGHPNQILTFVAMGFGKPGKYAFHVTIDGEPKGRADLTVVQGSGPPQLGAGPR
jgi:uncharacterized protein DUF6941